MGTYIANEDRYKVKVEVDNSETKKLDQTLKDVRARYKEAQNALEDMIRAGKRGTDEFKAQQKVIRDLGGQIANLRREIKGLPAIGGNVFSRANAELLENITTIGAGIGFVYGKIKAFVSDSVKEFAKQEQALLQLKAVTEGNVGQFQRLKQSAEDIQGKFGIADEEIQSVQAFLVTQGRTEEQIKKTIEAGRLLTLVVGGDLVDNIKKVDGGAEEVIGRLGKLDSSFKELSKEELEQGKLADLLIAKYHLLGDSIENSATTKIKKLEVGLNEFKEGAGEVIFESILPLIDGFNALGFKTDEVGKIVVRTVTGLGTWVKAAKMVVDVIKNLNVGFADLVKSFQNMTSGIPIVGDVFNALTGFALKYQETLLGVIGLQNQMVLGGAIREDGSDPMRGKKFRGLGKEPTANTGTVTKGSTGTGKGDKQKEKELNFLEKYQANVKAINDEITTLNSLLTKENLLGYERIAIINELVAKQKELNELLMVQAVFANGGRPIGNVSGNAFIRPDAKATPENFMEETETSFDEIYDKTTGMLGDFTGMVQLTGLMKTDFGQIVDFLMTALNSINSGFSFFSSLLGFINPVAGAVAGVASVGNPASPIVVQPIIQGTFVEGTEFMSKHWDGTQYKLSKKNI